MIDITNVDLNNSYNQVKKELKSYSPDLLKKKELVVLNKIDLVDEEMVKEIMEDFSKDKNVEVVTLTTFDRDSISKIKSKLISYAA